MDTCIYCTSKNSRSPGELLRCGKCQRLAHSTCLRSGIPPGQLEGDNFFEFTCQPCAKIDTDIVFRANLSITQLLLLTLYNLHMKNPAGHRKGFFHWELDIYKFIVQHWNDLFRDNGLGRKEHIRGIILAHLSQYPHFFAGGHDLVNDGGWYKLCQVLPPAVLLHQEAQKKKDRNTNQGGPTNKKARFEEGNIMDRFPVKGVYVKKEVAEVPMDKSSCGLQYLERNILKPHASLPNSIYEDDCEQEEVKVKEEIKVEEDHLEDFTEDVHVGQADMIVSDLLPPPLEESLFTQKKTLISNAQEDQEEEDSIRKKHGRSDISSSCTITQTTSMVTIKREDIVTYYLSRDRDITFDQAIDLAIKNHQQTYNHSRMLSKKHKKTLTCQFKDKWRKNHRIKSHFLRKNRNWLNGDIRLVTEMIEESNMNMKNESECSNDCSRGRPVAEFGEASDSTKPRRTRLLREQFSTDELAYATKMKLCNEGKVHAAKLCDQATSSSSKVAEILKKANHNNESMFSPVEALNIIVKTNMSKDIYVFLREAHRQKGCYMYPSYEKVLCEKQKCYPVGINVTEFEAKLPLQSLLSHTVQRLLVAQQTAIDICKSNFSSNNGGQSKLTLELLTKYGIDGSGDQALYSIKFNQELHSDVSEASILSSFICPIRLSLRDCNKIIWQNPAPSSPFYCRPVKLSFSKETAENTRQEILELQEAIANLPPTVIENVEVHHKLILTMVDGKVCQALTNTPSAASCYICKPKTNPSAMNNLQTIEEKEIDENAFSFGLSPQHLLINTMECILHIGYRMKLKTWMIKGDEKKKIYNEEKKRIYMELKNELGLNVDCPAKGSGTTNNGNTARRFFADPENISRITGVDARLIHQLSVLLCALNAGYDIDSTSYEEYAKKTANLYVELYKWYCMPVSVHKMLMHGSQVIESLCIPVGHTSEEGLEGTHKILRNARENHTSKKSRIRSNTDLMHWLLLISDPVLAGFRKKCTHKLQQLPSEVLHLLKSPEV
ncbi:uncharacterized protein LOC143020994 isoform X2 [Oratosquilla oratoria]|uniref:uncharacterized protein LOC143020994 isoform X2 n=1 Tax=Oratosquilla oratoria TaxID=337810 RepID=UPI003F757806